MRQSTLPAVVVAAALACGLSGVASAQFFLDLTIDSMSPVTCTTAGLSANGTGTSSYNLPPPPDNEIATLLVNGVTDLVGFNTVSPPSGTNTGPLSISIIFNSSHPLPYVATFELLPALGGKAVGRGVRGVANCPAGGPGTIAFSSIAAPRASAVPALSGASLAWLGALLALAGTLGLRRRRARSG